MKNKKLSIRILRNNNVFCKLYKDFILNRNMNENKYRSILSAAILFLNSNNTNVKRLGYRIVVSYCNYFEDYKPLYEIAVNTGLVPVAQFIEEKLVRAEDKNLFTEINSSVNKNFLINGVFCTSQQKELIDFYDSYQNSSVSVVAPTSYGKTDLIINTVRNNIKKNICVITPSKSLLAQTKSRLLKHPDIKGKKIVTHPDMYNAGESNIVAVLTQERVLRLLKKDESISFDFVIIDEAHGLLKSEDRNLLLASVIMILSKRNSLSAFKFLTPFLCDANNLKVRYSGYELRNFEINEYVKSEKIYIAELRNNHTHSLHLYDQFLNRFYETSNLIDPDEWSFIKRNSGQKNIIYFNKPKDIESFATELIINTEPIVSSNIEVACKNLAEYVHPDYRLISCLKRGVIYHHGDVPEPVRLYIEKLYAELEEIKYVITSSTLLEGVNLPADKMFVMSNKKGNSYLTYSDFRNLIGRVCRFAMIFDRKKGSLRRLEPEIFIVAGKYFGFNANVDKFIQKVMSVEKKEHDVVENVLLVNTDEVDTNSEKLDRALSFIENYERGTVPNYSLKLVETEVGRLCFLNNITEFDIFHHELSINNTISKIKQYGLLISNLDQLLTAINNIFLLRTEAPRLKRFLNPETQKFYKRFLNWRINNVSLNQMIYSFLKYWKYLIENNEPIVFVGQRWGTEKRKGHLALWTDISRMTDNELVNLAIVRIKEEQDFIDNILIKYVEVLNDLNILDNKLYLLIKYGTDNKEIITCTQNGLSLSLAKLLIDNYNEYIEINTEKNTINYRDGLIEAMQGENQIMICELKLFL